MQRQQFQVPTNKTLININGCHSAGDSLKDTCGYCKGKKPNPGASQWGITSERMTVQDYQKMMDRGWRRCGTYYYKYDFEKSCCQPYTIRLDTQEYQISHSQRKVMKRFNKFLLGEIDMTGKKIVQPMEFDQPKSAAELKTMDRNTEILNFLQMLRSVHPTDELLSTISEEIFQSLLATSLFSPPRDKLLKDTRSYSSNILLKIFYYLKPLNPQSPMLKDLSSFINPIKEALNKLQDQFSTFRIEQSGYLTIVNLEKDDQKVDERLKQRVKSKERFKQEKKIKEESKEEEKQIGVDDQRLYQQFFKEFTPLIMNPGQKMAHSYTVQITKALSQQDSFEVYSKYQMSIHGDEEKSIHGFERFLCKSPLFDPKDPIIQDHQKHQGIKDEGVWPEYLGSYHMIHRIDGEIFAVGVLDYSPQVLSSVYLYYDPKYEFLSPGTFTAVREIEYILRIQEIFNPEFKYYYMGYYFQDCQKSVYKASYKPSQVLCPQTYNYVYLTDEVRQKISNEKKPLLSDKPKIKELSLTEGQVDKLVDNFRFCFKRQGIMLQIDDLSPQFVKEIKKTIKEMYLNLGIDLMMSSFFVI